MGWSFSMLAEQLPLAKNIEVKISQRAAPNLIPPWAIEIRVPSMLKVPYTKTIVD